MKMRRVFVLAAAGAVVAISSVGVVPGSHSNTASATSLSDIQKIKHVVIVMQENRTFDTYFGTYPGADGIPMSNGVPTVCVPKPNSTACQRPFVTHEDSANGGPHAAADATGDIDGGKIDGFLIQYNKAVKTCFSSLNPACAAAA